MQIHTIETPSLGDRTYVVSDGTAALVIDPQRDIDRVLAVLDEHDLRLVHVFETHVHNDYVTGGWELADRTGAGYHVHADEEVAGDRTPIRGDDEVELGALRIRAVATPGHTPTHLSYVVSDGDEVAVFTGGSMLYGSVGRTDLVSDELTEELTRLQHRSVRSLAEELPDSASVHPTHGFGSFCSSGDTSGADSSTIAEEREANDALTIDDEDEFVATLLGGLDDHPAYYARMAPTNRTVPDPVDLSRPGDPGVDAVLRSLADRDWVVDLRDRVAFAERHLVGAVNIELADQAATHLGWLAPQLTDPTLLATTGEDIDEMHRQLVRIGIDHAEAAVVPDDLTDLTDAPGAYRVADFSELAQALDDDQDLTVLDARRNGEVQQARLPDALHIPLHDLPARMAEVPTDHPIWVHCASGYRAAIAASLLARSGRTPVLIDAEFPADAKEHLTVETS